MLQNEVAAKYRFQLFISKKIWQEFTALKTTGATRNVEDSCSVLYNWKRCLNNNRKEVERISNDVNIHHWQGKKTTLKNRKKESRKGKQAKKQTKLAKRPNTFNSLPFVQDR